MIKIVLFEILVVFLVSGALCSRLVKLDINWQGNNWTMVCDFKENDLSNVQVPSELCGRKYFETQEYTRFTWTRWNGRTW